MWNKNGGEDDRGDDGYYRRRKKKKKEKQKRKRKRKRKTKKEKDGQQIIETKEEIQTRNKCPFETTNIYHHQT